MHIANAPLWLIAARLLRNATLIFMVSMPLPAAEPSPYISDADWDQPKAAAAASSAAEPASPGKALATMALALVVILGLGGGALVLIKRIGTRRSSGATPRHLTVVETVSMGTKRSLSVLRIGDQVVLVGNHEHGMTALGMLPAGVLAMPPGTATESGGAVLSMPATPPPPVDGTKTGFAAVLENLIGRPR